MFWRQDPLVRCDACAALFWLDDIGPVGMMPSKPLPLDRLERAWIRWWGDRKGRLQEHDEWDSVRAGWKRAGYIGRVNFDDVVYVLGRSKGVGKDRVLWLRLRIWWDLNDRYRHTMSGDPFPNVPSWPAFAEKTNMEVILDMLRDGPQHAWHMIQQGELLRLLGRFDEAVAVLQAVPADGHSETRAMKIERLARSADTRVRELSLPTW